MAPDFSFAPGTQVPLDGPGVTRCITHYIHTGPQVTLDSPGITIITVTNLFKKLKEIVTASTKQCKEMTT